MARIKEKIIAQTLRKKGRTISEILEKVNASRSVISQWCRDIQLTPQQIKILADRQASRSYRGRLKAGERKRKVRIEEVKFLRKQGLKEVGELNRRDIFVAGCK